MMNESRNKSIKNNIFPVIFFTCIGIFILYEFAYGVLSNSGQYDSMVEYVESVNMECELKQGVPNNYYTGKVFLETPSPMNYFIFSMLTDEQVLKLKNMVSDKVMDLPCYEEYLALQKQDSVK